MGGRDRFLPGRGLPGHERAAGPQETGVRCVGHSVRPKKSSLEQVADSFGEALLEKGEPSARRGAARIEGVPGAGLVEQAPRLLQIVRFERENGHQDRVVAVHGEGPGFLQLSGRDQDARQRSRRARALLELQTHGQPVQSHDSPLQRFRERPPGTVSLSARKGGRVVPWGMPQGRGASQRKNDLLVVDT